jgi:hypothetical protein
MSGNICFETRDSGAVTCMVTRHNRPVTDISFKGCESQRGSMCGLTLGCLSIIEAHSDAAALKTHQDPGLSFVVPIAGSGTLVEDDRSIRWTANREILQLTHARPLLNDYEGFVS